MATHSSVLAGKIPRTAEVDRIEATEHSTGLCLRSWTARPAPTHTHTVLIINYQERPTWGKRPVPNPGGEQGTGFQDDLELVFLGPKLSATSYLSRHRNFRTPALPPLPWWNFQSKCHSLGRGRACIVLTLKESRGVTGCRSCIQFSLRIPAMGWVGSPGKAIKSENHGSGTAGPFSSTCWVSRFCSRLRTEALSVSMQRSRKSTQATPFFSRGNWAYEWEGPHSKAHSKAKGVCVFIPSFLLPAPASSQDFHPDLPTSPRLL